jgi:lipid A ethanolaminephosphotransferase
LGEHGVFLYGLPNIVSPEAQRHVPAIMWFGEKYEGVDLKQLEQK